MLALLLVPISARTQGKPADERLDATEDAYLKDMGVIHLVPAD